ncbi:hypothetical protein TNCV_4112501 [Trichonephila clavipes]|nr:hypothetical protein TNCV_4112501 [Trichonephila clavipes]
MSNGSLNAKCASYPLSNKVATMPENAISNANSYCNHVFPTSKKVSGVSEIRIKNLVSHPETHRVLIFSAPTHASSVPELAGRPALSGKVTGFSKTGFHIIVPNPEKYQENISPTPRILIQAPATIRVKYARLALFDAAMGLS